MADLLQTHTKLALAVAPIALGSAALTAVALSAIGKLAPQGGPLVADARQTLWLVAALTLAAAVGLVAYLVWAVAIPFEHLARDLHRARAAVVTGDFEARVEEKQSGPFAQLTRDVNATLGAVDEKVAWYVGIIDAVPFPIHVTDADMKWTYMNRAFEILMQKERRVVDRREAIGKACSNATANICNTEGCGIRQFNKGVKESYFDWCGMECKQDTAELLDKRGKRIGYVEVVSDLTPLVRAKHYTATEVERLKGNLERLAAGNMNFDLQVAAGDKHTTEARTNFLELRESLAASGQSLRDLLGKMAQTAAQVSSASSQIASTSQSVASGASEQAQAIEETSSRLTSMATKTKQSAESARRASELSQGARDAAAEGTSAMEQMLDAMAKIRTSAEGTSQIIRDINDIAFQTNLLALNAAVEAARAGEAGRGFAVVAEEVRSLALRSKEAARKTEELIRQSVQETEEGVGTSKHVNDKLSEIARGVAEVTDIVSEIASMATEQANGIAQVVSSVSEMEKVTQQNAASSQESSAAAEELASQSSELSTMVTSFGSGNDLGPAASARSLAPRNGMARDRGRSVRRLEVLPS